MVHCSIINLCESVVTFKIVKCFWTENLREQAVLCRVLNSTFTFLYMRPPTQWTEANVAPRVFLHACMNPCMREFRTNFFSKISWVFLTEFDQTFTTNGLRGNDERFKFWR